MDAVRYRPQEGPQTRLLEAIGIADWFWSNEEAEKRAPVCSVIGYGGAAYGGKTYGFLGTLAICAYAFPGAQMTFFRRTYAEMTGADSVMRKAELIFEGIATPRDEKKEWLFDETGAQLYFRHCENESDVAKYLSQAMDILAVDEATTFEWQGMIDELLKRNRVSSASGIIKPFALLASNPGSVGHGYYMQMFNLDKISEWGEKVEAKRILNPNEKYENVYFIPAYMEDNKIGLEKDPDYGERLKSRGEGTYEALVKGLWRYFSGQALPDFNETIHTCDPFEIPPRWPKWRAEDWGYSEPMCVLWFTQDPASQRIYVYREIYGTGYTDPQQCDMIHFGTPPQEQISITYAPPELWTVKTAGEVITSTFQTFLECGVLLFKADNDRLNGKRKIHALFALRADGKPGIQIFKTCYNLIRTLPKLASAPHNPEDVNPKGQEDHPYDCLRYGLSNTVPLVRKRKQPNELPGNDPWKKVGGML